MSKKDITLKLTEYFNFSAENYRRLINGSKTVAIRLGYKHVNMLGHYSFTLADQVMKGQLRPLKNPSDFDDWP